jgi:cytochrome c-type biogenesis protein CcsB
MMNQVLKFIVSTRMMAILFVVYAFSMGYATFVENDYGTPAAKSMIYEAWWFEIVMLLLILNFCANISRYRLFRKEKLPLLIFHLSFIIIFIGGAVTRYISFEGLMKIREGESSNEIITDRNFLQFQITNKDNPIAFNDVDFQLSPKSKNFKQTYEYEGKKITLRTIDFYQRAQDSIRQTSNGNKILELVTTTGSGRKSIFIESGKYKTLGGNLIGFNVKLPVGVSITEGKDGMLQVKSSEEGSYMIMASQTQGKLPKDSLSNFNIRSLYSVGGIQFVVPTFPKKGEIIRYEGDKKKNASDPDLIVMEIQTPNVTDTIAFYGGKGNTGVQFMKTIDGMEMGIGYGSKIIKTPFDVKLRDFQMEKYPGSNAPSSYASEVTVIDGNEKFDYRIFMNNVLDYNGYRFFQASFDNDEQGTVLSVNHDFWGTNITYVGYFFLFLGMFLTLFWKGTRFWKLFEQLKTISSNKTLSLIILFLVSFNLSAQENPHQEENHASHQHGTHQHQNNATPPTISPEKVLSYYKINSEHSEKFGSVLVQNIEGRIVPINTLALQLLRKLSKKDDFHGMSANSWFLAISSQPMIWTQVPLIKVNNKGGEELLKKVQANEEGYTTLIKLFPINSFGEPSFILEDDFKSAFNKRAANQTNFDKEVIELNEKVVIMQNLISNQYLKIIPIPNDANNTWSSWMDAEYNINEHAKSYIGPYLKSVIEANTNKNWRKCNEELNKINQLQQNVKDGVPNFPSTQKVRAEIWYNKVNLFFKLMIFYSILGFLLLIFAFTHLFTLNSKLEKPLNIIIKFCLGLLLSGFIIHLVGLILRWYISGHAPWSNGYEAVIFISWCGVLAGFLLYKNSNAFIPAAGCLVAVIMMGFAHGAVELNPQITPLVPVLKSYWLNIHVAIITSSYAFFGLSALIGCIVLMLFILNNKELTKKVVQELSIVNELSLTIGLFLLTIGTFLGGIWANESWGRYWSWDPKETWAFISVIVYAFVIHMRLVPGLRGYYSFNLMSLLAFSSIIMTYFGVNYYLSGLHSYAAGDAIPIPSWIYITLAFVFILSISSYYFYRTSFNRIK